MGMISTPSPVTSANQIKGVLSPFYVVADYTNATWNNVRLDLWIWKGAHTAATSSNPNYVLTKRKLNDDDVQIEINIADYVADTINPVFSPFNGSLNKSDYSFFYYELRYFNDSTEVYVSQSELMIGALGWRYDYQFFDLNQAIGGGYFPNGYANNEFGYSNLDSKLNYFKYTDGMVDTPSHLWYTDLTFPIDNVSTMEIYYDDLVTQLDPNQIECSPYNYGIGFINKSGNWDMIPVFGKVTISTEKSSTKYNRAFRYKTESTQRYQNSVREVNNTEKVTYTVNTGKITPLMSAYLESLIYSPMLFIVDYDKNLAYPVKLDSNSFVTKNHTNDKNNIQHTLTFVGDNNKLLKW